MIRCKWPNLENNDVYIEYHDNEWGVPSYNDDYLFEMILLESFHCGLSWLIILKKREAFRKAFDNFDPELIKAYDEKKIDDLMNNKGIVRNRAKILANIENAKAFIMITSNELSDKVLKDMKKRGFKFMGSVTTYSYLEAIGVMNNHSSTCFRAHGNY